MCVVCQYVNLGRKDQRHQRNLERKEKRDRIKVRRLIFEGAASDEYKEIASKMFREINSGLRDYIESLGHVSDTSDRYAEEMAQRLTQETLRPIDVQREIFVEKGRKGKVKAARAALFDYEVKPKIFPWFKSWSDIAKEFGCTRAALSTAAKQLPPGLRRRSRAKI